MHFFYNAVDINKIFAVVLAKPLSLLDLPITGEYLRVLLQTKVMDVNVSARYLFLRS